VEPDPEYEESPDPFDRHVTIRYSTALRNTARLNQADVCVLLPAIWLGQGGDERSIGFAVGTRIVHPFASNHYRRRLHPDSKTDDHDLEAIFHAAINGYGLATLPVGEVYLSLQAISRHRHNLVKQRVD
jgi:Transposase